MPGDSRRVLIYNSGIPVSVDAQPAGAGVWWLAGSGNHRSDSYLKNVAARKLKVDKDLPIHGRIQAWPEELETMEAKKASVEH